jgi:hypothetical protein
MSPLKTPKKVLGSLRRYSGTQNIGKLRCVCRLKSGAVEELLNHQTSWDATLSTVKQIVHVGIIMYSFTIVGIIPFIISIIWKPWSDNFQHI